MCYQQSMKDRGTLSKVPKCWLHGQRKRCCSQQSTGCLRCDSVSQDSGEPFAFESSLVCPWLWVLWGCLLIGFALSSRNSHWFWWANEIITMCQSITLFLHPSKRRLFKIFTVKLPLGDGMLAGSPSELLLQTSLCHPCLGYLLLALSDVYRTVTARDVTLLNESWDLGMCCCATWMHTGFCQTPCTV